MARLSIELAQSSDDGDLQMEAPHQSSPGARSASSETRLREDDESKLRRKPAVKWQLYYFTMVAAASELANGYDIGAFSLALLYLKKDPEVNLTSFEVAVIVGMFNLVAALGCLLAGPVADWCGRKTSLIGGNAINFIGTLILTVSRSFGTMFLGRFVMGLGAGIAFMGPELYASEISPPHVRGLTSTWGELFINFGILIGYLSGWALGPHWRLMVGLGAIIPCLSVILQTFIPESPRWLVQKGREEEARAALRRSASYSAEEEDAQVREIVEVLEAERSHDSASWHELLCPSTALAHAMIVGWGAAFFQQANGSEGVVYYTPTILEEIGILEGNTLYAVTAAVGLSKALFVGVALLTMDRIGRLPLLVASSAGVITGLLMLGCAFSSSTSVPALAATGLCVFMASFSVGWGPLAGVLLAEVFPLRIRGSAVGIGWSMNRLVSGSVALLFQPMSSAMGVGGTFFFFSAVSVIALFFSYFVVPETRGASLEDISRLFDQRAATSLRWRRSAASLRQGPLSTREWEGARNNRE